MINFTPFIKRLFYLFIFFSISTFSFSQNPRGGTGLPNVRTEDDGGGTHSDCYELNGADIVIDFTVVINTTTQTLICPLVFGYTIPGSDIEYLSPLYGQAFQNGDIVYTFELTITSDDAVALCNARLKPNDMPFFEYNFYCGNNGEYELYDPLIPNGQFGVNLCCANKDFTSSDNDDDLKNRLNSGTITDVFTLDNHSIKEYQIANQQEITYYLYDMYGNQVEKFQNYSSENSIQNLVSRLSIRSGVYFVRYLDGTKIRTQKVFKH